MFAQVISTLRLAYGDFSAIDPLMTFDYKYDVDLPRYDDNSYKNSFAIAVCSFLIFLVGSLFLFMMFLNIIIAVICDTYDEVKRHSVAHDYKQRIELIYELEVLFHPI